MSRERDGSVDLGGLAFFGALIASVTHELSNVLSIVDQAGGLLGDLAAGSGSESRIAPRHLEVIRERIDRQVRRGVEILTRTNHFAHCLDQSESVFDSVAETENLVSLARRFADLKKVRMEYTPSGEEIRIGGDAFTLQHCIFICLRIVLDASAEGDRLEVGTRRDGDDAIIYITASARCTVGDDDLRIRRLARLMESLDGVHRIRLEKQGDTVFELRFHAVPG